MSSILRICAHDKTDEEHFGAKYGVCIKDKWEYTNDAFGPIYRNIPNKIELNSMHFDPDMLALYANSFVSEGYEMYYKPEQGYVYGFTMYFKISKEAKEKIKNKVKKLK